MENNKQWIEKALLDLVLLGDPRLYQICDKVTSVEKPQLQLWKEKMHHVMEAVRAKYGFGRAIAAPQVGIMKRVIYLNIEQPLLIINPQIIESSEELFELWDDCMSFPNLLVRIKRHRSIKLRFLNEDLKEEEWDLENDLSELLQHEIDHLNGILCTMRAIDNTSFKWRRIPD